MSRIWVGTDCGKSHHHCLVMDTDGDTLLSRRVPNDEPELLELIGDVLDIASGDQATWAMDMTGGEPALLIELLLNHGQELVYIPGIAVNRATDSYRGVGKTDARDAKVIADQARMRRDLQPIRPADEAAIELRLLTEHRSDLVADRTRTVNRLKSLLTGMFPGPGTCLRHGHHRRSGSAHGLSDTGGDPPGGQATPCDVAAQPQGPHPRRRRGQSTGCR